MGRRSFAEDCSFLEKINDYSYRIKKGFVPNMNVSLVKHVMCDVTFGNKYFVSYFMRMTKNRWRACFT